MKCETRIVKIRFNICDGGGGEGAAAGGHAPILKNVINPFRPCYRCLPIKTVQKSCQTFSTKTPLK